MIPTTTMRTMMALLALMLGTNLLAADVDLSLKNPAIDKLRLRMSEREAKVNGWKDKGAIGEEASGLLAEHAATGIGLAEKKEVRDLIVAENEDRYALFRELRIAHNIPEAELAKVAEAFAAQRREAAGAEHWVQNPADKKWVQKKELK
jgi:uncharacterized protein YdbL (DUF1318 family)